MRVPLCIRICMVQPVHNSIRPGAHVRRPLGNIGDYEEKLLPPFTHTECSVSGVAMLKKCLGK